MADPQNRGVATDSDLVFKILRTFPLMMHTLLHDFDHRSADYELNRTQYKTIMLVHYERNASMSELCTHMNMEKGSFTSVIDGLIRRNLLQRVRDPEDRRRVTLAFTPQGERFIEEQLDWLYHHVSGKLEQLQPADRERFMRALNDLFELSGRIE
jgi:DNA-binding MarR family transcriptional regulator